MFRKLTMALLITLSLPVAAAENPFSTNDLSVLIPLNESAPYEPKFVVHPGDKKWPVLPEQNFAQILSGAESQGTHLTDKLRDKNNWYLVALRYSPCTLFHGATPACKEQLRFVFQSLNAERGLDGFDDYAIHVVYNFSGLPAPLKTGLLESFRELKNRFSDLTIDRPLAVNPVLLSPRGKEYFEALRTEIVTKHLESRGPSLATFIGLGGKGSQEDHWVFLTGDIDAAGKWSITPLNVGAPSLAENMKVDDDEGTVGTDLKVKPGQINLFDDRTAGNIKSLRSILDQHQTNDHNVTCASCHVADARVFPVLFSSDEKKERADFLKYMSLALKDKTRVTEYLIDNSIHVGKMGFEAPAVRIFGYLDNRALLSQRVVNDSALAVEQANALLGLIPKPQCTAPQAKTKLIDCLYLKGPEANLTTCLRSSCRL